MVSSRPRPIRGVLLGLAILLAIGLVTAALSLPATVESSMNKIDYVQYADLPEESHAVHEGLTIVDMHADTLLWKRDLTEWSNRGHVDLPRLQSGNVAIQVFSSVSKTPRKMNYDSNSADSDNITLLTIAQWQPPRTWNSLLERSLFHAEKLKKAVKNSDGHLRLLLTGQDIDDLLLDRADNRQLVGAIFSAEGLQNLEGKQKNLKVLYDAGLRMASFTHFFDNELAGSMHGEKKGGLTELGRAVMTEMEDLGIIVDIAHASPATVDEILKRAKRPVVSSHGGVQATCNVNRNLTDDQIRGIALTGGVVGIGYWDGAVCEPTVKAVVDAIEHVIKIAGIETVALGSDFDGAVTTGWDTSELFLITDELLQRGYSQSDISLIMGGNTLRVLTDVLSQ